MSCDKFEEYIALRIDGRLDAAGERRLQEHLAKCQRCRKALAGLEAAEKTARSAPAKEPRAGYWDTFSGRVMGRIETEEARREEAWWKRWVPVTLPPPGKRMRFAAGVASIAVAVVVGALFVSRQGDRAVPTVGRIERSRDLPAEVEPSEEKGKDMLAEGQATSREEDAARAEKPEEKLAVKLTPPPAAKTQAAPVTENAKDASAAGKKDAPPSPAGPQKAPEPAPTQVAEAVKEEAPQEKRPAAAENEVLDAASPAEAAKEEKPAAPAPAPAKLAQPPVMSFTAADKGESRSAAERSQTLRSTSARKGADNDTTLSVEGLRAHITAWKNFIEETPADSLREEGYREIANAYTLLAMRTQDEADIDEGARFVRSYLESSKDPATREYLAAKLQEIQALPKK